MAGYSTGNADRLRWQVRSHITLARFLDAAIRDGLPAIAWTIATTGAITGTVNGLGVSASEQRRQFEAWAVHLQATPREQSRRDGSTSLYAAFEVADVPAGAIRAELVPPMVDEGGDL